MTDTALADPIGTYIRSDDFRMLIGGEFVEAVDNATAPVMDPSTGQIITSIPDASAADVEAAVTAAQHAQEGWRNLGPDGRADCFRRFGELLVEHREELAMLDAIDSGNPVTAMRIDIDVSLPYVRGWPEMARWLGGEVIPASPGLHYTSYVPYGVVGRITAFNHPVMFAATRPLPALITGNTVVMKPAPQTSLSTLGLARLFADAFPPGVMNIVSGGAAPGDSLVTHPAVKRIAFTGSVPTGLLLQRRAAESGQVKHLSLELGGKNAMVVMPDADIDEAVEGAIFGMNFNVCQGQSCGSNSRVLVHRRTYDEFVAKAAQRLAEYRVGVAYDDDTEMGPMVSSEHASRVLGYVERGVAEGATLVTGGEHPDGAPRDGFYMTPVVFADVQPAMAIARDEIFGPVMSVMAWDDYDQMLEIANGLDLGLTASVWTHDLDLAHRTAAELDAGYVWVNDSTRHYFGTPFGGTKNSGTGREESRDELLSYMETKVVHTRLRGAREAFNRVSAL